MLIENGEIGHRVRTKLLFVSSVLDGQFHETWYSFREIPVLRIIRYSRFGHDSLAYFSYLQCLTTTNLLKGL